MEKPALIETVNKIAVRESGAKFATLDYLHCDSKDSTVSIGVKLHFRDEDMSSPGNFYERVPAILEEYNERRVKGIL